jgi:hypothetical protein
MAHACNPNYSGGRDQEDHGLKLVVEGLPSKPGKWGLEFKPQYHQKKKKNQFPIYYSYLFLKLGLTI